jgi:hypothetical protein
MVYGLRKISEQWRCSVYWFKPDVSRKRILEDRNISFQRIIITLTWLMQSECKHCTIIIIIILLHNVITYMYTVLSL